jgi:MATE family multidrug resistance protein
MFKEFARTFKISLPLIISNIAQISLGLIDSAMIGAVDYKQLAASSLALNAIIIPQVAGNGIAIAISPLTAIANGRNDIHKSSGILFNGFLLTTLVAVILSATLVLSNKLLFHLGQDVEVATYAVPFYTLMAWSLVPMLMFSAVKQFCDGLEFTKTAMTLSLASLPLNAFLNWIFIFGKFGFPRMELAGAGYGTLITRILIAIILIGVVLRHRLFRKYIQLRKSAWKINGKTWKELLHIGIPTSLQYGMEVAAFAVSAIMIGWLGATSQAAHQIAINLASATFVAALGFSMGGSIRIANAYGRNDNALLKVIGKTTFAGGVAYGVLCGLLFIIFRFQLPYLFTQNNEVAALTSTLLIIAAIFQISDATRAIGIPVGYFLSFIIKMGALGIWIGFVTGLTASSILLNTRFQKKVKGL